MLTREPHFSETTHVFLTEVLFMPSLLFDILFCIVLNNMLRYAAFVA